jgi:N-acyl-D-aspartate/D-glutamate deacylase
MLEQDGKARLYIAFANFPDGSLDLVGRLLQHPDVVPGLGDGGAHCGSICDGSYSTFLLTHWTRDRAQGRMKLEEAVKRLSHNTARLIGLNDRGLVKPGLKADLNVIDHGKLSLHAPEVTYDLPANGRRLVQKADGFTATVVNGVVTYRNGEHTGALPGRLVRSA